MCSCTLPVGKANDDNRRSLDDHDRWDRANNDDNSRSSNVEQGRVSDIARRQSLSVEEECTYTRGSNVHGRLDRANVNRSQTHISRDEVHCLRKQYSLERWYSVSADELSSSISSLERADTNCLMAVGRGSSICMVVRNDISVVYGRVSMHEDFSVEHGRVLVSAQHSQDGTELTGRGSCVYKYISGEAGRNGNVHEHSSGEAGSSFGQEQGDGKGVTSYGCSEYENVKLGRVLVLSQHSHGHMICGSGREIALDSCTASHRIGIGGGKRSGTGGVKNVSAGEHSRKRSGMTRIGSGIDVSKDGSSLVELCRDAATTRGMRGLSNDNELSTRGGAEMSCGQDGCERQAESSRVELGAEDEMSNVGNGDAMQTDMNCTGNVGYSSDGSVSDVKSSRTDRAHFESCLERPRKESWLRTSVEQEVNDIETDTPVTHDMDMNAYLRRLTQVTIVLLAWIARAGYSKSISLKTKDLVRDSSDCSVSGESRSLWSRIVNAKSGEYNYNWYETNADWRYLSMGECWNLNLCSTYLMDFSELEGKESRCFEVRH